MNEHNTQKKRGFALLIASLALDERDIMKQLSLPEDRTFSLPVNTNFFLWQAFHTDLKQAGKNPQACMKYVEERSSWLSEKYMDVNKEKQRGFILQSASSELIVRDICLALLSGIDEDKVLELFKPILSSIDYVVFIDRRLTSTVVQNSHSTLGKQNMEAIRAKMLSLSKKLGWKIINLRHHKFQADDLREIRDYCHVI